MYLRSRTSNATPHLCWVFYALLQETMSRWFSSAVNKGGLFRVFDTHLPRFEGLAYFLPHSDEVKVR